MRRIYDLLNILLLGSLTYGFLKIYPTLPGKVSLHFDIMGRPDRHGHGPCSLYPQDIRSARKAHPGERLIWRME